MNFPQQVQAAATLQRAVATSGRWIDNTEHTLHLSLSTRMNARNVGQAPNLLDAATRMHDSSDPRVAKQVIAGEALRLIPADGVMVLDHHKNILTLALHLPMASDQAGPEATTALRLRPIADQLLEPGHMPAAQLDLVQQALLGSAEADIPAPARWRSALVADLDHPRIGRPTRLLWYATTADAFTAAGDLAVLFAGHAGLALQSVTERHNLLRALEGRTVTGQATGILMHRYHLTAEQALEILRRYSQEHHRKVRDVAETITYTGALPT